jgi:phosphate transport system protein
MNRHFDEEINGLKERLLHMGSLVEKMIAAAVTALTDRREDPAREVNPAEEEVNRIQIEVDEICMKLLALHQPTAIDLRLITSAMKINSDLERMADQAVNITETLAFYLKSPLVAPPQEIAVMSRIASGMVKDCLDAFVKSDPEAAKAVLKKDDEVDACKREVFVKLVQEMTARPECVQAGLNLILISRNIERIGDHATNIAEDVIYMVLGKDIRHHINDVR